MTTALLCARVLLAAVFALAAVTKLADLRGSQAALAGFGIRERLASPLGTLLPFAELAVAVALLPAGSAREGALGALVLLGLFVAAIARSMARGEAPDCHCFGQLHSEPAGWRALTRNAVLAALAAFIAISGWSGAGPSAIAWIGRLDEAGAVALAGGLVIAALAATIAWALMALLRQNGRLLVRIDDLEARVAGPGAPPASVPHRGLSLGEQAPDFTLAGLYGESVTLESLTSSDMPVLLLFTDPKCGPCNALMPQISAWQREHAEQLTIAVLTRGSVHDNRAKIREHGIANVWLDDGLSVHSAYQANGTPGAVLIDADGRIASPTVEGEKAISGLVAHATRPPEVPVLHVPARQAPPRRPAVPPVGARAPSLQLNDLAGARVALTDPERDTLVLFWNPRCGFCRRMLDDVRTVEKSSAPGAPRLLMISTGSVADNEAMRLQSPIALDAAFAAASAFGSSGTPSAILIDANGKVASGLAMGEAQVMALAMAPSERGA